MSEREDVKGFFPVGSSGLNVQGGRVADEWQPKLRGSLAVKAFREMADEDAIVGAVLWAIESQVRQCPYTIEAADEGPQALRSRDHVETCIEDMSHTWSEFLSEVLGLTWAGFSLHEIVYKVRRGPASEMAALRSRYGDGLIGWRKLPPRAQETIAEWVFDDDGGVRAAIQQAPPKYARKEIPIERALLFRARSHKASPEGRSMLRNAWRSWYMLRALQRYEGIGAERDMAGVMRVELPVEFFSSSATTAQQATVEAFRQLGEKARRGEHESIVVPTREDSDGKTGYGVDLIQSGGRRPVDLDAIIRRYESRIAVSLLGESILLGMQGSSGSGSSWSLASSKTHLFALSIQAILRSIEDVFNRFAISRLIAANGWPLETAPRLVFADIETDDSSELAASISALVGAGALTAGGELETYLRQRMGIPVDEVDPGRQRAAVEQLADVVPDAGRRPTDSQTEVRRVIESYRARAQAPEADAIERELARGEAMAALAELGVAAPGALLQAAIVA